MSPEVSVVMSVHNDAEYLNEAIESILSQQGVSLEFIIVDDGSSDGSSEILDDWASKDSRIRLIRQENSGLTKALIHGCEKALGEFIARQDGDDLSLPNRLKKQADMLRSDSRLVFVSSYAEVMGPGGESLLIHKRPADANEATDLLLFGGSGPPGHGSVMFRRESYLLVGGYRAEFYFAQDCDLWFRLAENGLLSYVPKVLYRYRISPKSVSGGRNDVKKLFASYVDECRALRLVDAPEEPVLEECRMLQARVNETTQESEALALYFLGRNLLSNMPLSAGKYLVQSVRTSPFNFKAWLALAVVPVFGMKVFVGNTLNKRRPAN